MPDFRLEAPFQPTGDQPQAIDALVDGIEKGLRNQVLLGVTGSGKSYTIASVIERANRQKMGVAVHCTAGLGRTGTILAAFLVSQGLSAERALERIRKLRPGSVETSEQVQAIEEFARRQEQSAAERQAEES